MDSMRLEKSYRLIPRELSIEYCALESGLDRFVKLDKAGGFLGRNAVVEWRERGFANAFVTLEVHGTDGFDARGSEAIYQGDELVGRATSGGFGGAYEQVDRTRHGPSRPGRAGYRALDPDTRRALPGDGDPEAPYDPDNERLRA